MMAVFALVFIVLGAACTGVWLATLNAPLFKMISRGAALLALSFFMFATMAAFKAAGAHEPYSDWKIPGSTTSCCDNRDCRPVTATPLDGGAWMVNVDGRQVVATPNSVLKIPSPDGRSHWCGRGSITYCFVPGEVRI